MCLDLCACVRRRAVVESLQERDHVCELRIDPGRRTRGETRTGSAGSERLRRRCRRTRRRDFWVLLRFDMYKKIDPSALRRRAGQAHGGTRATSRRRTPVDHGSIRSWAKLCSHQLGCVANDIASKGAVLVRRSRGSHRAHTRRSASCAVLALRRPTPRGVENPLVRGSAGRKKKLRACLFLRVDLIEQGDVGALAYRAIVVGA